METLFGKKQLELKKVKNYTKIHQKILIFLKKKRKNNQINLWTKKIIKYLKIISFFLIKIYQLEVGGKI